MKDISDATFIIADKLASFIYKQDNGTDIFHLLLNRWNDVEYLYEFYFENEKTITENPLTAYGYTFEDFSEDIMSALEQLENLIEQLENKDIKLDSYFKPLKREESKTKILSLNKKQCKWLRIYAIRIDENLYAITGGAIKITKTMQEHKDTLKELAQLDYTRAWLLHQGVETNDSFQLYFDL